MRSLAPSIALCFLLACADAAPSSGLDAYDPDGDTDTLSDTSLGTDADGLNGDPHPRPIDLAIVPARGTVVAGQATRAGDLVGGPKAEGLIGDFVLANNQAKFVIEGLREAAGYRFHGGLLVDADLQPGGEDLFTEMWFAWNFRGFKPTRIEILSDGHDGEAIIRAEGDTFSHTLVNTLIDVAGLFGEVPLHIAYEYRLKPDTPILEQRITLTNPTDAPVDLAAPATAIVAGDGAEAFTPGPGLKTSGGTSWQWSGAVGLHRSYGLILPPDNQATSLFEATNILISTLPEITIPAHGSHTFSVHFVVGDNGSASIESAVASLYERPYVTIQGQVQGQRSWRLDRHEYWPGTTLGRSWVALRQGRHVQAIVPVRSDGSYLIVTPPGDYEIQAFAPSRGASEPRQISATDPTEEIDLSLPALGDVVAQVRDPEGNPIPAQVTFFRVDAPSPFAPEELRFGEDWGRNRAMVLYHLEDEVVTRLLPGSYEAVASRGFSWEIDTIPFEIEAGAEIDLTFTLEKTVDDTGWSAAELHMHNFWSPDSTVPYAYRLRQAAANAIQLPIFTEHTYLADIQGPRAVAGTDAWVTPIPGQEVSTVEYGHFNAWPLEWRPDTPFGGGVFEHAWEGAELFSAIRAQTDRPTVIQVNHPRISPKFQAYFETLDLDSTSATAAEHAERWTEDWDLLEVFNRDCIDRESNRRALQDWINLYNLGIRKTMTGGTDTHAERDGIGEPRNYVPVDHKDVDRDLGIFVDAFLQRRSFISCGPFVSFQASDGTPIGGMTRVDAAGQVTFDVRVEAPSWMQIDRVQLRENGLVIAGVDLKTWERPQDLPPAVRFDAPFTVEVAKDSWYVLEVLGSGGLWPLNAGTNPYALTNPIDVDADGNDHWTPPGAL